MSLPFFLDQISDDVIADFAERSIVAEILVGEWEKNKNKANPRVIFGLGDGDAVHIGDETHYGPGAWIATGSGTTARALFANNQKVIIWVTSPAASSVPATDKPRVARANTWALASATMAALWRSHGGILQIGGITWLNEDRGAATYGAALSFIAAYPLPVLDDDLTTGTATQYQTQAEMDTPDGTTNPPETSNGP